MNYKITEQSKRTAINAFTAKCTNLIHPYVVSAFFAALDALLVPEVEGWVKSPQDGCAGVKYAKGEYQLIDYTPKYGWRLYLKNAPLRNDESLIAKANEFQSPPEAQAWADREIARFEGSFARPEWADDWM